MLFAVDDQCSEEAGALKPCLADPIAKLLKERTEDTLGVTAYIQARTKPWSGEE